MSPKPSVGDKAERAGEVVGSLAVRGAGPSAAEMIARGGWLNFIQAVRHVARYSHACDKAGELLSWKQYIAKSGRSMAQVYRDRVAFRACCGEEVDVLDVLATAGLIKKGWTEEQREEAIARTLAER